MRKQRTKLIDNEVTLVADNLKKNKEVEAIIWFGSSLNGNIKPISDIDIAVILKNPSKKMEAKIFSNYSDKLDLVNFSKLPLYIQFEVLKTGKIVYLKDKHYFSELARGIINQYLEMSYLYEIRARRILA